MRPGIGRNPGLAHWAGNSCELRVELSVQYAVVICADTGFEADIYEPLLRHKPSLA